MSLDKAIKHRKEKRKPYYNSGRFDRTCRCHGSCPYCMNNRLIQAKKEELRLEGQEDEFFGYWFYPDPLVADMNLTEEVWPRFGIDPWDFDQLRDMDNWREYLKAFEIPDRGEYDELEREYYDSVDWSME